MHTFATDLERLAFLLEAEAAFSITDFSVGDGLTADGQALESGPWVIAAEERPKYITNYIGSKQKLVDWIWKNTPDDVKSVLDAFSGSAVVAYMFKSKGLQVTANDRLRYCSHAARAIVENSKEQMSPEEIEALVAENPKAGTFVRDNFNGIFFHEGVHAVIDQIRANCDQFDGFKKDIALFALGKSCLGGKGGFGHFSASTGAETRGDSPDEFRERVRNNAERINALVFDNGQACSAHNEDVNALLPKAEADLVYFDPPYATEFSTTNYEKSYHFIEGLMTYWKGLTINPASKVKAYDSDHETVTKGNAQAYFQTFLGNAKHIPQWLISYRDHAYPNEEQMQQIIGSLGRDSQMESKDHQYSITAKHGEASSAQERLFICKLKTSAKAEEEPKQAPLQAAANFHTSIPVEICLRGFEPLSTEAMQAGPAGDPQFTFVLCRTGTNKNGDHFLAEELTTRHATAINKKIDLQHSQDFSDIVGGIIASDYLEDEKGGRVECVGELYVGESEQARLAHKLMRKGIISQVSMECDYAEGECSICGKRVRNKSEYCAHLRKSKGGEINGKPVYEILHGVTFSGLGLLDRKGADENARILQVASVQEQRNQTSEGGSSMDEEKKSDEQSDAAKGKPAPGGGGGGVDKPVTDDPRKLVTELEQENKELKAQVSQLQKRIQELEAEQKSAANKSRASKLINRLEKQGVSFGDDDERECELKRLAEMSDDAFTATEAAYTRMAKHAKAEAKPTEKTAVTDAKPDEKKESAKASEDEPMRSDAGVRPRDVEDRKSTLQERLREGFMAAYESRVGGAVAAVRE